MRHIIVISILSVSIIMGSGLLLIAAAVAVPVYIAALWLEYRQ